MSTYTEDINPYKRLHMRRAFRMGWDAAERGLNRREAQGLAEKAKLNRATRTSVPIGLGAPITFRRQSPAA